MAKKKWANWSIHTFYCAVDICVFTIITAMVTMYFGLLFYGYEWLEVVERIINDYSI
jgi:hypothetical protein